MGLDTSHNAFHGAYSAFNTFRQAVCRATGGSFPPHWLVKNNEYVQKDSGRLEYDPNLDGDLVYFGSNVEEGDGLYLFLTHSDCDGEFTPEECTKVADALEQWLPEIEKQTIANVGHIEARGGIGEVTRLFIRGCREAADNDEPLIFA